MYESYWDAYVHKRAETKALRDAILALDLALTRALPTCTPDCYRAHRLYAPLVALALVSDPEPRQADHVYIPNVKIRGEAWLAVSVARDYVTGTTLDAGTRLRLVARQTTASAYFQQQDEFLYQIVEGERAGAWLVAIREAAYGPVDLLFAGLLIAPVHPASGDPGLGERLLEQVARELFQARAEEAAVDPPRSHAARLRAGRPWLVEQVLRSLGADEPGDLGEVLEICAAEVDCSGRLSQVRFDYGLNMPLSERNLVRRIARASVVRRPSSLLPTAPDAPLPPQWLALIEWIVRGTAPPRSRGKSEKWTVTG